MSHEYHNFVLKITKNTSSSKSAREEKKINMYQIKFYGQNISFA